MTIALPDDTVAAEPETVERLPGLYAAGLASLGAGAIHAAAVGIHSEHVTLTRLFIATAIFQLAWGVAALTRPSRWLAVVGAVGSAFLVLAWLVTRLTGISFVTGLEVREAPQLADTMAAALGAVAMGGAMVAALAGKRQLPRPGFTLPGVTVALLAVAGMIAGTTHVHDHGHASGDAHEAGAAAHDDSDDHHATDANGLALVADDHHADDDAAAEHADDDHHNVNAVWPRPFDPDLPLDISGVPGVTPEQEERAAELIVAAQRELPAFADPVVAESLGYRSIGDGVTGFEHFINRALFDDDKFLDPTAPESLVYRVDGDQRTLVSAMFIAPSDTAIDDPELVDFGGPLMEWHLHDDLCWGERNGTAVIVGLIDAQGNCPNGGMRQDAPNAMVHVWITPHQCGPFAALEGVGAGRAADGVTVRADQCGHGHGSDGHDDHQGVPVPPATYHPDLPINLSGVSGVTLEQQARAENLIAVTLRYLPRYADPKAAEADGFRSIRDGGTGYEHYINWSYLNDEHELDPLYPESLVYQARPDGSKELVAAMFMIGGITLDEVPDVGGVLTQWHIHNDLCFSADPFVTGEAFVVGVSPPDRPCRVGIRLPADPMLHVWIVPHECGPFAALEGIAGGQIREGEERWCDHAHGGT